MRYIASIWYKLAIGYSHEAVMLLLEMIDPGSIRLLHHKQSTPTNIHTVVRQQFVYNYCNKPSTCSGTCNRESKFQTKRYNTQKRLKHKIQLQDVVIPY